MSQSAIVPQAIDKGAAIGMKFLLQVFAWRDINGGDGLAFVPTMAIEVGGDGLAFVPTIDRGRETALPSPHHLGTAGIDLNPLAGKSKLRQKLLKTGRSATSSFNPLAGKSELRHPEPHCSQTQEVLIPLRGKVNCDFVEAVIDLSIHRFQSPCGEK